MTKKYSTKRALVASIITLCMCFTMLIGTTFAWFTDSVTSSGNIIKSGKLDVEMYWADGSKAVPTADADWTDASTGAIFDYANWEPGYVQVRHIKIANEGTLALKYKVNIVANGEVSELADVIDVYYVDPAVQIADRAALTEDKKLGTLTDALANLGATGSGNLAAGEAHTITIAFKMQESAGNEYQDKSIGADFSIQILATQNTVEADSFDNKYDTDSIYPVISGNTVLPATPEAATDTQITTGTAKITLPADAIKNIIANNSEAKSITVQHAEPVVDAASNTVTFDFFDLVDDKGEVIDLSANTTPFTMAINLGSAFADGTIVDIYHDGELIASSTVSGGVITYDASHLCEISISTAEKLVANEDGVYEIANAKQLLNFAQEVNKNDTTFDGKTVVLTNNIDLAGYTWTPIGAGEVDGKWIGFNGIFDGQGYTVSNLKITKGGGWNGLFGLIGRGTSRINETISNLTVKNVTIENANRMSGGIVGQMYGSLENCHVENVTINAVPNLTSSGYDNGDKIGGLVGWLGDNGNNNFIKNSTANNVTLKAYRDVGGITGYIGSSSTVEGCAVDTVSITVDQSTNHYGVKDTNAGAIVGRIYKQPVTVENNTETNVTIYAPTFVSNAANLADAIANGGNIALATDINDVDANTVINIPSGVNVTLDLNGHKISATANKTGNQELFNVKGTMTVKNGFLELAAQNNQGWNYMATIFDVTAGGVLNMDGVTANVSGTDMNFIVHLNNWGSATLNVNDCDFTATYVAVRAFNSGYDMNNVTIENTDFHTGRMFWVHNYTSEGKDDSTLNLNIYGNNNTSDNAKPIRFGFSSSVYYDINGDQIS